MEARNKTKETKGSVEDFINKLPEDRRKDLYITTGPASHPGLLKRLGKNKTGVACLYIKSLVDVDQAVLEELVRESVKRQEAE
jgi:hypothetical protein